MSPETSGNKSEDGRDEAFSHRDDLEAGAPGAATLEQLKDRHAQAGIPPGTVMKFELEPGHIAYNISQAFEYQPEGTHTPQQYVGARVEAIGDELSSTVRFFRKTEGADGDVWVPVEIGSLLSAESNPEESSDGNLLISAADQGTDKDVPFGPTSLQDPAVAAGRLAGDNLQVVAVVQARELHRVAGDETQRRSAYHQEFFTGSSIEDLERIASGPNGRKGTRLVYLGDTKWGVFNRPQGTSSSGQDFGPGRITYTEFTASDMNEFKTGLESALQNVEQVVPGLSVDEEWVGLNQAWPLENDRIGGIGHLARFNNTATGEREYCAISFIYDPATNITAQVQIIATKASFPDVRPREDRGDLENVIYPGGAEVLPDGKLRLYCGVSDNAAGYVDVADPFPNRRSTAA